MIEPVEVERIIAHPDKPEPSEALVADIAATMNIDAVNRRFFLFFGKLPRFQRDHIARTRDDRLGQTLDFNLDRIATGFGAGKFDLFRNAVDKFHRRNLEFGLAAKGAYHFRIERKLALLSHPTARRDSHLHGVFLVEECIADNWVDGQEFITALFGRNATHIGIKPKIVEVANAADGVGIAAVAPVVLTNIFKLYREADGHIHFFAVWTFPAHGFGDD